MGEYVRSVRITIEIDTSKATYTETVDDLSSFAARWNDLAADDLGLPRVRIETEPVWRDVSPEPPPT